MVGQTRMFLSGNPNLRAHRGRSDLHSAAKAAERMPRKCFCCLFSDVLAVIWMISDAQASWRIGEVRSRT